MCMPMFGFGTSFDDQYLTLFRLGGGGGGQNAKGFLLNISRTV